MVTDSTVDKDLERNRKRIEAYLADLGYSFERVPHPRAAWSLKVTTPNDLTVGIVQTKDQRTSIGIDGRLAISEDQRRELGGLSVSDRMDLIFAIRLRLLDMRVEFFGVDDPLVEVYLQTVAYIDGLTKAIFADRLERIIRGKMAIILLVDQKLGYLRPNNLSGEKIN